MREQTGKHSLFPTAASFSEMYGCGSQPPGERQITTSFMKCSPGLISLLGKPAPEISVITIRAAGLISPQAFINIRPGESVPDTGSVWKEERTGTRIGEHAMAFIGDSLHLSRPISDSFALVRVGDIEGVKVRHSNQEVGKTNEKGELIVPNLISYHDNKISLEPTDIPLEYDIRETSKYVSVPYRGGGITDFGITKVQAVEGRIFFRENGEKIPAEYIGLELKVEGRSIESVVGEHGTFYLENLSPGTFPARIFSEDRECRFEMVIPEMRGAVVNLGDIICEVREDIRTYSADGPGS